MISLIDLTPWADRLKAQCPSFTNRVFKTIPDDDLSIDAHESPVAFIYLSSDRSGQNGVVGSIRQAVDTLITVEIVVRRTATATDKFNEAASDTLRSARIEVLNALVGWKPADCKYPVLHSHGELKQKQPKVLKFAESFSVENDFIKPRV